MVEVGAVCLACQDSPQASCLAPARTGAVVGIRAPGLKRSLADRQALIAPFPDRWKAPPSLELRSDLAAYLQAVGCPIEPWHNASSLPSLLFDAAYVELPANDALIQGTSRAGIVTGTSEHAS
jgi:hypothetical protein